LDAARAAVQEFSRVAAAARWVSSRTPQVNQMETCRVRSNWILAFFVPIALSAGSLPARAEIGHFNGGFLNIRDYLVPPAPGIYTAVYGYFYSTDRINNGHGDKIHDANLNPGPGPGVPVHLSVDVDLYAVSPVLIWEPDVEVLGGRYAALAAPLFANASLDAVVSVGRRLGGSLDNSSFDIGDLFVEPLWLGWSTKHFDVSAAYGFYAAVGKYDTDLRTNSVLGTVRVEDTDNIGYGFWTHQVQGAGAWYPFDNKGTAVVGVATYEHHSEKKDFDLQPGDNLTLNWGISQFIPLERNQQLLLEIGPAGYQGWQISNDRGADARSDSHDRVHAVGGQVGLTSLVLHGAMNFHGFYEYETRLRTQGYSLGLSFVKKF
jgi:hypothetical protein